MRTRCELIAAVLVVAVLLLAPSPVQGMYQDGMNVYQYCHSSPSSLQDPDGRVVVVASGLLQSATNGRDLAHKIAQEIKSKIARYAIGGKPIVQVVILGMGDQQEEDNMKVAWWEFIRRKQADVCNLEQFVIAGHSDGATAMNHIFSDPHGWNAYEYKPAYMGLVDLVREIFDFNPNTVDDNPLWLQNRPKSTFIDSFRQNNGAGIFGVPPFAPWKGRSIKNADRDWVAPKTVWGLNHFSLWKDASVQSQIAGKAAEEYFKFVETEIVRKRNSGVRLHTWNKW